VAVSDLMLIAVHLASDRSSPSVRTSGSLRSLKVRAEAGFAGGEDGLGPVGDAEFDQDR
jgi:hypothetical protein